MWMRCGCTLAFGIEALGTSRFCGLRSAHREVKTVEGRQAESVLGVSFTARTVTVSPQKEAPART